jgi:hypothetical protein
MNIDLIIPLAGMATGLIVVLPIVRAVVRLIERRGHGSRSELDALSQEVRALSERVASLQEQSDARLIDVEERVDFAERMLAQREEVRRVKGGEQQ